MADKTLQTLQDLVIKLQEGTRLAEETQEKFGSEKIQFKRFIKHLKEKARKTLRKSGLERFTRQNADRALDDLHRVYRNSIKFLSKEYEFLMELPEGGELNFLKEQTYFCALLPNMKTILDNLEIALLGPEEREHFGNLSSDSESSGSNSSDDRGNHSAASINSDSDESDDESENESVNEESGDRFSRIVKDFNNLYKTFFIMQNERDNYVLLLEVYQNTML